MKKLPQIAIRRESMQNFNPVVHASVIRRLRTNASIVDARVRDA